MIKIVVTAVIALVVGLVIGVGAAAGIGLLGLAAPTSRMDCLVDADGVITVCTNQQGHEVKVPHDIHIRGN